MLAAGEEGSIVSPICDGGERYAETYFNNAWLESRGLDITPYVALIEQVLETGRFADDLLLGSKLR